MTDRPTTPSPEPLQEIELAPRSTELRGLYAEVAIRGKCIALRPVPVSSYAIFACAFLAAHPGRTPESVTVCELAQWWVTL